MTDDHPDSTRPDAGHERPAGVVTGVAEGGGGGAVEGTDATATATTTCMRRVEVGS